MSIRTLVNNISEKMEMSHSATYNVLHNVAEEAGGELVMEGIVEPAPAGHDGEHHYIENADEEDYDDHDSTHDHHGHHKHEVKQVLESFDFNDVESIMWRKVSI